MLQYTGKFGLPLREWLFGLGYACEERVAVWLTKPWETRERWERERKSVLGRMELKGSGKVEEAQAEIRSR